MFFSNFSSSSQFSYAGLNDAVFTKTFLKALLNYSMLTICIALKSLLDVSKNISFNLFQ